MIFLALYTISDLHLSFSNDKPMDIFRGWENHTERLKANWNHLVKNEDTVVLPGDFSWALKLEDTLKDFQFLNSLNGKKIILKGNHDLWWQTKKKTEEFLKNNKIDTVKILFNNAYLAEGFAVCGTRGWFYDCKETDKKVLNREVGRLEASINEALKLNAPLAVFLHYPPVYSEFVCKEIITVLKKYDIKKVYHGHIHGAGLNNAVKEFDGIKFKLVSCDCNNFTPIIVTN